MGNQLKLKERKENTLHGRKVSISKEEYSCLIQPTKPSSIVKLPLAQGMLAKNK